MIFKLRNIATLKDDTISMPFSQGEAVKRLHKEIGGNLVSVLEVDFDDPHKFQDKEIDGYTGFEHLIFVTEFRDTVYALFFIDEGVSLKPIASYVLESDELQTYERVKDRPNFEINKIELKSFLIEACDVKYRF